MHESLTTNQHADAFYGDQSESSTEDLVRCTCGSWRRGQSTRASAKDTPTALVMYVVMYVVTHMVMYVVMHVVTHMVMYVVMYMVMHVVIPMAINMVTHDVIYDTHDDKHGDACGDKSGDVHSIKSCFWLVKLPIPISKSAKRFRFKIHRLTLIVAEL